jgi:hypothetical protein
MVGALGRPLLLSGAQEFGCGFPQPCITNRILRKGLHVAFLVFDDECTVSEMRPAVVEDD